MFKKGRRKERNEKMLKCNSKLKNSSRKFLRKNFNEA